MYVPPALIYMHIDVCMCACAYIYIYVHTSICKCICVYVHACTCIYACRKQVWQVHAPEIVGNIQLCVVSTVEASALCGRCNVRAAVCALRKLH